MGTEGRLAWDRFTATALRNMIAGYHEESVRRVEDVDRIVTMASLYAHKMVEQRRNAVGKR